MNRFVSKAITTRVLPVTTYRPMRIVASDLDGNRATIIHPGGLGAMPHHEAVKALCTKMAWSGADDMIAGAVKGGYVFVFREEE